MNPDLVAAATVSHSVAGARARSVVFCREFDEAVPDHSGPALAAACRRAGEPAREARD